MPIPLPVVLMTDFGLDDVYTGILKGVIAGISPATPVIDLTHGVAAGNVFQGAYLLSISCRYFPQKSVFCAVVDPGVGSRRKGICIQTPNYYFVGPDNGLLWPAAEEDGIVKAVELIAPEFFLDPVSNTFHGRDVFAPVCARLSKDTKDIECLGPPLAECQKLEFPKVQKKDDTLVLTVLHIDHFGNITLNLDVSLFHDFVAGRAFELLINGTGVRQVFQNYEEAGDDFFLIAASTAYMEISLKNGNAAQMAGIRVLDRAHLKKVG